MRKIIFTILLFLSLKQLHASSYYVSTINGDDSRTASQARNRSTPWKTISKVNASMANFAPGDSILFKRGEVFPGGLLITVSGAPSADITFGAYGTGGMPEITGFATLSGWTRSDDGIWETTVPTSQTNVNIVTINDVPQAMGRYPNASAKEQGWLHYGSFSGNTSVTDSKLSSAPTTNWVGAELVIRKTRWIIDRGAITSQSSNTINFTPRNTSYPTAAGYGYFIQNARSTLDLQGEWYFNPKGKKFDIYSGSTDPSTFVIKAGVLTTLVNISDKSYLSFQNLLFTGSTYDAFDIRSCKNIHINRCSIKFSGENAITIATCDNFSIENSLISHTLNTALSLTSITNAHIKNNKINGIGIFPGMGNVYDGCNEGINYNGSNALIENNIIDSTGYIPISFGNRNIIIKNNVISNFNLVKDDGGGIYGGGTDTGKAVLGNIIFNGSGNGNGTDAISTGFAEGIYMDDNTANVLITNNTVFNCSDNGIYLHNANNIGVKNNTIYNNSKQLSMFHSEANNSAIFSNIITGNIFFAVQPSQLLTFLGTISNDIGNFGIFDNNYYCRPTNEDGTISVLTINNGTYKQQSLSLSDWKYFYNKAIVTLPYFGQVFKGLIYFNLY